MRDNPYKNALDIQDGCNLCGLVQQFAKDMLVLAKENRENGGGTDDLNRHPVVILYLDKLCDLARYREWAEPPMMDKFSAAYDVCKEKSGD